jgi:two-component system, sensor histidine kinase and response regulator
MSNAMHIDNNKALQWLEGDERMLMKIRDIFKKNVPSQVESLRSCLVADDASSTERLAHTIMGSSAMLGANVMSDEARKIEQSAIEGDMDSARLHFTRFVVEYEKIMGELAADGGK